MARVKDMSEAQKVIIPVLWETSKTPIYHLKDNKANLFKMVQLQFQTQDDEHQLNRILISNLFANADEISKAWNNAGITVSQSTTLQRLHQLRYDGRIPKILLTFQQKQKSSIWARDHQNWSVDQ